MLSCKNIFPSLNWNWIAVKSYAWALILFGLDFKQPERNTDTLPALPCQKLLLSLSLFLWKDDKKSWDGKILKKNLAWNSLDSLNSICKLLFRAVVWVKARLLSRERVKKVLYCHQIQRTWLFNLTFILGAYVWTAFCKARLSACDVGGQESEKNVPI